MTRAVALGFWRLLADAPKYKVASLFLLMLLAGLTDGIGLLLLVPLLAVIDGGSSHNPFIEQLLGVLTYLGIPPAMSGLLGVFVLLVACRSAIQYGREQMGAILQHELVDQLRLKCFRALLGVEWRWLVSRRQ